MGKLLLTASGVLGFLAVALGAFGAHGLKARWAGLPDSAERLGWWQTAVLYHLAHALALGLVALLWRSRESGALAASGLSFLLGVLLFSGSLYALALSGVRPLGAVTPFGGLAFLVGWAALTLAAVKG